jgi:hypothetical protein
MDHGLKGPENTKYKEWWFRRRSLLLLRVFQTIAYKYKYKSPSLVGGERNGGIETDLSASISLSECSFENMIIVSTVFSSLSRLFKTKAWAFESFL